MTSYPTVPMNCDQFDALLAEYMEDALDDRAQHSAEAHVASCARCRGLVADLIEIRDDAARLPVLKPTHDLWDGITARIETPEISVTSRQVAWRARVRLAAAAVVLIAATATITWQFARKSPASLPTASSTVQPAPTGVALTSNDVAATYDKQITEVRRLLDSRAGTLDSGTMRILAINMRVIDDAIARMRTALDSMPANALLTQKLAKAYELKLNTLRQFAAMSTE